MLIHVFECSLIKSPGHFHRAAFSWHYKHAAKYRAKHMSNGGMTYVLKLVALSSLLEVVVLCAVVLSVLLGVLDKFSDDSGITFCSSASRANFFDVFRFLAGRELSTLSFSSLLFEASFSATMRPGCSAVDGSPTVSFAYFSFSPIRFQAGTCDGVFPSDIATLSLYTREGKHLNGHLRLCAK